jgi:hypothetical protein
LVVSEVVSIASEKVTEILVLIETSLWLLVGEIVETVGAVVSGVLEVVVVDSSFSLQENMMELKIMERIMRIYLKELPVSGLGIHGP